MKTVIRSTLPMHRTRARLVHLLAFCAVLISQPSAADTSYPTRPIRLIVPAPAGTSPDVIARAWGAKLRQSMGQPVIVDNRPGGVTIIGAQAVASASPDGYTLLYTIQNTVSTNPHLYKDLPYKASDFSPIAQVSVIPMVLVVPTNSPYSSLADLLKAAKDQPGRLNYATSGIGTSTHLAMARLLNAAGVTMTHVPFKDGGTMSVVSGTVDASFDSSTVSIPLIKGGRLRALAVASVKRLDVLPNVPAVAETLPGFSADAWQGLFAPKGTPAEIVNKLATESQKISLSEDFQRTLRDFGLTTGIGTPNAFSAFLVEESRAMLKTIQDNDIKLD